MDGASLHLQLWKVIFKRNEYKGAEWITDQETKLLTEFQWLPVDRYPVRAAGILELGSQAWPTLTEKGSLYFASADQF
jgi:hypothetical protein